MGSLEGTEGRGLRTEFCVQHSRGGGKKRKTRSGPESTVGAQGAEIPLCQMQRSRRGQGRGEPDRRERGPLGAEDVERAKESALWRIQRLRECVGKLRLP